MRHTNGRFTTHSKLALFAIVVLAMAACSGHEEAGPSETTVSIEAQVAIAERASVPHGIELFGTSGEAL